MELWAPTYNWFLAVPQASNEAMIQASTGFSGVFGLMVEKKKKELIFFVSLFKLIIFLKNNFYFYVYTNIHDIHRF